MITVEIFRNKPGDIVEFQVRGHADAAPHGQDIVCAGVSALTQSALLGMKQYLKRELRFKASSGLLTVELRDKPDAQTNAVLETMLIGLTEIAKLQPDRVRVLDFRR